MRSSEEIVQRSGGWRGSEPETTNDEESRRIFKQQDEYHTSCSDLIEENSPRSATLQRAEGFEFVEATCNYILHMD